MSTSMRPFSTITDSKHRKILSDCIVCLTGFTDSKEKQRLISVIRKLGGIYTPNLQFERLPTHLIVKTYMYEQSNEVLFDSTDKLEFVLEFNESHDEDNIFVVSADWLLACEKKKRLVNEEAFHPIGTSQNHSGLSSINKKNVDDDDNNGPNSHLQPQELLLRCQDNDDAVDLMCLPIHEACNLVMQQQNSLISSVFSQCQFYVLTSKGCNEMFSSPLARCIRIGLGTNCWEVHEKITHFVLAFDDNQVNVNEKMLRTLQLNHPNRPYIVSPQWVLASLIQKELLPQWMYKHELNVKTINLSENKQKVKRALALSSNLTTRTTKVPGATKTLENQLCYISANEVSADNISYSITRIQSALKSLNAVLWTDDIDVTRPRTLYVVGYSNQLPGHESKIQKLIQRRLICVEFLTPIFVLAAHTAKIGYNEDYSIDDADDGGFKSIFRPMDFIPRKVRATPLIKNVTLTGFVRLQRHGILHLLSAMGIHCTENMQRRTHSHLICSDDINEYPNASSQSNLNRSKKYKYALQWGTIHLVSFRWVYHIAKFGYESGCEENFRCDGKPNEKSATVDNPETIAHLELSAIQSIHTSATTSKEINDVLEPFTKHENKREAVITPGPSTAKRQRIRPIRRLPAAEPVAEDNDDALPFDTQENVSPMRPSQSQVVWFANGETEQEQTCYLARD